MSLMTIGTVALMILKTPFGRGRKVVGGACTYISWAASYFIRDIAGFHRRRRFPKVGNYN